MLNTAKQNNGRVLDWLQSERVRPFAIDVRSSDAHVQLRSAILEVKFDEIHSLPAATERTALRAQLEGLAAAGGGWAGGTVGAHDNAKRLLNEVYAHAVRRALCGGGALCAGGGRCEVSA